MAHHTHIKCKGTLFVDMVHPLGLTHAQYIQWWCWSKKPVCPCVSICTWWWRWSTSVCPCVSLHFIGAGAFPFHGKRYMRWANTTVFSNLGKDYNVGYTPAAFAALMQQYPPAGSSLENLAQAGWLVGDATFVSGTRYTARKLSARDSYI